MCTQIVHDKHLHTLVEFITLPDCMAYLTSVVKPCGLQSVHDRCGRSPPRSGWRRTTRV